MTPEQEAPQESTVSPRTDADSFAAGEIPPEPGARVLIIDDDVKLQNLLREYLEQFGYRVESRFTGAETPDLLEATSPDLIILDIMLPQRDGFAVLQDIRKQSDAPVIMLTARGEDSDRIVGLEMGADDYLPKPFNPRELLARMKAVLRRTRAPADAGPGKARAEERILEAGGFALNRARRTLLANGREEEISTAEYRLLEALMERPNEALSRDAIMNITRGRDFMGFERSIDVHISRIRARLKKLGFPGRIKTIWGTGYMFIDD